MRKARGFRLGRRLIKVFHWCIQRRARTRRRATGYIPLEASAGALSKFCKWVRWLGRGTRCREELDKKTTSSAANPGYIRVGQDPPAKQPRLPKGHLAVYVGSRDGDTCRVLVPVIYFNHPLFVELLREAEKVHGFDHPGGIQIPCARSEFESVTMRVAAATHGGGIWRRRWRWT